MCAQQVFLSKGLTKDRTAEKVKTGRRLASSIRAIKRTFFLRPRSELSRRTEKAREVAFARMSRRTEKAREGAFARMSRRTEKAREVAFARRSRQDIQDRTAEKVYVAGAWKNHYRRLNKLVEIC